jgi:hypothetical protein
MNEDIIPITYMSGTGGHFLCHFIVSAKRDNNIINLSPYGNVHEFGLKDIPGPPFGVQIPDIKKINSILNDEIVTLIKPYYTIGHIRDIELLGSYFKKFIRIIYDIEDIAEISSVFLGKYEIDQNNVKQSKTYLEFFHNQDKSILTHYAKYFTYVENYESSLFVSWKEIYHLDPTVLINKLHNFTNIPIENFSIDMINTWRTATKNGVDKVKQILNGQESI